MVRRSKSPKALVTRRAVFLPLALLAIAFFCALWVLRGSPDRISGDESTYVAMAESVALDFDLRFDAGDRQRLLSNSIDGRKSVILQRAPFGIAYSKPIVYPLAGAPFYRLFGTRGLVLLNALLLGGAVWLLARWLARLDGEGDAIPTLVTFAAAGLLLPYVAWKTGDLMQAALAIAGLALCLEEVRARDEAGSHDGGDRGLVRRVCGGFLLGLLISLRLTNALVAVIPVLALVLARRRRSAIATTVAIAATFLACVGATRWFEGSPSPYRTIRATFNAETGYPVGTEAETALRRFDFDRATYDDKKELIEPPLASAYSAVYFLAGRYTGLILYFPMAFVLVGSALRRPDRTSWVVLAAVGALSVFYLVYLPFNYFGGATCIGNRYFLVGYAALPFALTRPVRVKALVAVWCVALLTAVSALASVITTREDDRSLLNHAHAGVFRWLPYESTAAGLAGGRDVFWKKEFARFVDPYSDVSQWKFRLGSDDPPTEIGVANLRPDDRLRFLVLSAAPEIELVYRDWGRRVRIPLRRPLGKQGLVEIEPSRPLRRHPLWFRNIWDHGLPYYTRVFRLAVRTPGDQPIEAEIRYLGLEPWPEAVFSREVVEARASDAASPETSSRLALRIRNTSTETWTSQGVFPVYLSYRLTPLDGSGTPVEGPRSPLGVVPPGAEATRSLTVEWPSSPGRYRLTADLLVEGVSWFAERVGEPVFEAEVAVGALAGASTGPPSGT